MIRYLKAASLIAALATVPVAAVATTAQAETVRIPVADLQLQSVGDPRFEARLDKVAQSMCGSYRAAAANTACQAAVKDEARENLAQQLSRSNTQNLAMATGRR